MGAGPGRVTGPHARSLRCAPVASRGPVRYFQVPATAAAAAAAAPRFPRLATIVAGILLTLVFSGIAGATGIYFMLDQTVSGFQNTPQKKAEAAAFTAQKAQPGDKALPPLPKDVTNVLLLGSDQRTDPNNARSDTIMLVRMDPRGGGTISTLSFPRDLYVPIKDAQGRDLGSDKINAAYDRGGAEQGAAAVAQTIEGLTGQRIDHYFNVDFKGFTEIVDKLGGVWVDVDRRYFHKNGPGLDQYDELDIKPGYQLLSGADALDYVRYRHGDSDFARIARQQLFQTQLKRAAEQQKSKLPNLIKTFSTYASSDISDGATLLKYANLAVTVPKDRTFRYLIDGAEGMVGDASVVQAAPGEIQNKVNQWLNAQPINADENTGVKAVATTPVVPLAAPSTLKVAVENGNGFGGEVKSTAIPALRKAGYTAAFSAGNADNFKYQTAQVLYAPNRQREAQALAGRIKGTVRELGPVLRTNPLTAGADLIVITGTPTFNTASVAPAVSATEATVVKKDTGTSTLGPAPTDQASAYSAAASTVTFGLLAPTLWPRDGRYQAGFDTPAIYPYELADGHGAAVTVVAKRGGTLDKPAAYFGIEESSWKDAPILGGESFRKTYTTATGTDQEFRLYYDGKILKMVAWIRGKGVYWITNSLDTSYAIPSRDLVCIARSMRPVTKTGTYPAYTCQGNGR